MNPQWESTTVNGNTMTMCIAKPEALNRRPAVVVNHVCAVGKEEIQSVASRLADAGYVAIVPDYYHRHSQSPAEPERESRQEAASLGDAGLIAYGITLISYLRRMPEVDPNQIGLLGFGTGGRIAHVQATAIEDFRAIVAYCPADLWVPWGDGPSPIDRSSGIRAPLLYIFGEKDSVLSRDQVAELDREFSRLGKMHEFRTYPGAGRNFQSISSANYDEPAAAESWFQFLRFFKRQLG